MKRQTRFLPPVLVLAGVIALGAQESKRDEPCVGSLTVDEVHLIEERLPRLRPGMSREEVYGVLGDDLLKKVCLSSGRGPMSSYAFTYYLRRGYNLVLVYDMRGGVKFKRAGMAGEEWEREERAKSQ